MLDMSTSRPSAAAIDIGWARHRWLDGSPRKATSESCRLQLSQPTFTDCESSPYFLLYQASLLQRASNHRWAVHPSTPMWLTSWCNCNARSRIDPSSLSRRLSTAVLTVRRPSLDRSPGATNP